MTIPKSCKRLAEVDFPIAEVSRHAVREKSIRHGHPSTLHLWWARRPLASSRAMLMALLLPDPADEQCPPAFAAAARQILAGIYETRWHKSEVRAGLLADGLGLRRGLLDFIADFADWDKAADAPYLAAARALVKAAHGDETPLVVDPFAGGGSIPLEALRLGCDAFASDLNPVAVLINKVMLEDIPRYGKAPIKLTRNDGSEVEADGLAEALRIAGAEVKAAAEAELAQFYPPDPDGSRPIAYLWARTVRCEAPNCGAEIPLVRSWWLAKKANRKSALRYTVKRTPGQPPQLEFEMFQPATERDLPSATISQARATCPCCSSVLPPERVRAQLSAQRGGASVVFDAQKQRVGGARLLAVVTLKDGVEGRRYRLPTEADYETVWQAQTTLDSLLSKPVPANGLAPIPDEAIPFTELRRISIPLYGMNTWGDLFTARQSLMLVVLSGLVSKLNQPQIKNLLAIIVNRLADGNASLGSWLAASEDVAHVFGRQAVGMVWDFAETSPLANAPRSWRGAMDSVTKVVDALGSVSLRPGQVELADAATSPLPSEVCKIWFTDPPYYDSVPYAHLSDFFYVWLRRTVGDVYSDWFRSELTLKSAECVVDRRHYLSNSLKDAAYYEAKLTRVMAEGKRVLAPDGIAGVVFAHKTTDGWEALIGGMVQSGLAITASWPISTERASRLVAMDTASLASSVHLVCRPRSEDAPVGDWSAVFRELPLRVSNWMDRLEPEGVRGADLVFACIGPALEIYSQYSEVVDAEDRPIPLGGDPTASEPHRRGYLAYVWETVARLALARVLGSAEAGARNGAAGALEEDARLTALFLWTLQATDAETAPTQAGGEEPAEDEAGDDEEAGAARKRKGGMSLPFDVARRFAQPLGIHLPEWEGRIIDTDKGVVRLVGVGERAQQLFGAEGAAGVAAQLERSPLSARNLQLNLFAPDNSASPKPLPKGGGGQLAPDRALAARHDATTLDRVHAAMLLQKSGRTEALRSLLAAEQAAGPAFLRLANALSGLYPKQSEEKRLVDAMLLAYPK